MHSIPPVVLFSFDITSPIPHLHQVFCPYRPNTKLPTTPANKSAKTSFPLPLKLFEAVETREEGVLELDTEVVLWDEVEEAVLAGAELL